MVALLGQHGALRYLSSTGTYSGSGIRCHEAMRVEVYSSIGTCQVLSSLIERGNAVPLYLSSSGKLRATSSSPHISIDDRRRYM